MQQHSHAVHLRNLCLLNTHGSPVTVSPFHRGRWRPGTPAAWRTYMTDMGSLCQVWQFSSSASSIKTSTHQEYNTKVEKKEDDFPPHFWKNKNKTSSVLVKKAEYQDITVQWKSNKHCWLAHWSVLCKVTLKSCLSEEQEIWWNGDSQPTSALLRRGWEKGCDPFGQLRSMFGQPHKREVTQHSWNPHVKKNNHNGKKGNWIIQLIPVHS